MVNIFEKYLGKHVLLSVFLVAFVLTLLSLLVAFIDKTRHIGTGEVDFLLLLEYILLQIPTYFVLFFPVSVLLGGILVLGNFAKTSELVVLQSFGFSRQGIIFASLKVLLPFIIIVLLIGEFVAPKLSAYAENTLNYARSNGAVVFTKSGVWLREGQSFIGIKIVYSDNSLNDIVKYDVHDGKLKRISNAKRGVYKNGQWRMYEVKHTLFSDDRIFIEHSDEEIWNLSLNPERVEMVSIDKFSLNITALLDYIRYLEENNQDASSYRLKVYLKLISPITIVTMLLLAASTVFGSLRTVSMGARVVTGIGIGFSFYLLNEMGSVFALAFGVPAIISATVPTLLFLTLSIYILKKH